MICRIVFCLLMCVAFPINGAPYEYINYYLTGENTHITFDVEKGVMISGHSSTNVNYQDCSNDNFRCIKIDDEYIFAPKKITESGQYTSSFGKYIVYTNEGGLPFNKSIDYKIINLYPGSEQSITIFYNSEHGIIAFIDSNDSNNKIMSAITWLKGRCGLLSDEQCTPTKKNRGQNKFDKLERIGHKLEDRRQIEPFPFLPREKVDIS